MVKVYIPVDIRNDAHQPRSRLAVCGRVLWRLLAGGGSLIVINPRLIALATVAFVVWAWGTPHLRFQYAYTGLHSDPRYVWCEYVGVEPFKRSGPQCPIILWKPLPAAWFQIASR